MYHHCHIYREKQDKDKALRFGESQARLLPPDVPGWGAMDRSRSRIRRAAAPPDGAASVPVLPPFWQNGMVLKEGGLKGDVLLVYLTKHVLVNNGTELNRQQRVSMASGCIFSTPTHDLKRTRDFLDRWPAPYQDFFL